MQLIRWHRLPTCAIPGRELIKPPGALLPSSIYLSSSEAACCSYAARVRLTFVLTFKLYASSFPVLSPSRLPTSCCSSASGFDLLRPGLFQRLTLPGLGWAGCRLFLFSVRRGHCVTVKLLSGGGTSGVSHVGSVESFVYSLNKKRKRQHLQDPHLPWGVQGGAPSDPCPLAHPGPAGRGRRTPGKAGACQGGSVLGSEASAGPEAIFTRV